MEHISVVNTRKSKVNQEQNSILPLEQDVAVRYLIMIGKKYSTETALKVALTVINCMAKEMLSPDAVYMAMYRAKSKKPEEMSESDYLVMLEAIHIAIINSSKKNPISGMF